MGLRSVTSNIKSFLLSQNGALSVAASLVAVVAAGYGVVQYFESVVEEKVKRQTEVQTELLSALFVQRANSPYNAARRFSALYVKTKSQPYPQDLKEALATTLLYSIAESRFPEEFENIVVQVEEDKSVSLQRYNLNAMAYIYIQLGNSKKAVEILNRSLSRIERDDAEPRQQMAEAHWFLALSHLSEGNVPSAAKEIVEANRLRPDSYKLNDLVFRDENGVRVYISDNPVFARLQLKNERLPKQMLELSRLLKSHVTLERQRT